MPPISITVNGETLSVKASPATPLLWVLRDSLGLTGTKFSCGKGLCGACTVHIDGEARQSCVVPLSESSNKTLTTIEGLSPDGDHPLQLNWITEQVPQCGYCQPGQIMTAAALLAKIPNPTDEEVISAMSNVLCRCGTYQRIRRAVRLTIKQGGAS
jgi:aerobic-type carbon monoxide dehydrogenase small subunit (CoxS/CutS family)